jgi:hypothetical protein
MRSRVLTHTFAMAVIAAAIIPISTKRSRQ